MANAYTRHLTTPIPQSAPLNELQVPNSAGGYTFTVDDKSRLERFLILGTDGGTYYIKETDLTKQNVGFLVELIERDPTLVIDTTTKISVEGRAFRNSPAIFVMALVFKYGSVEAKGIAKSAFSHIIRTSTHLFEFAQYVELLGGWGGAKRRVIASWYTSKTPDSLAYQAVKYRQRDGWTHRDLFRLSHPKGINFGVGNFILGKEDGIRQLDDGSIILGFNDVQRADSVSELLRVLDVYKNLPWEAIPTQFLTEPKVWKKLFYNGQVSGQALVRNITRLSRIGAFSDMVFTRDYADRLTDDRMIERTKLHPIQYLLAATVHDRGQVNRRGYTGYTKDWATSPIILDALNEGFRQAFKYVPPTNKRTMIALDVSGSMSAPAAGIDLSCAELGAAMAIIIARTEQYYSIYGFSDGTAKTNWYSYNYRLLTDLGITPTMDLTTVLRKTTDQNFGNTDCALPMIYAKQNNLEVDTFVIITDNETWWGDEHPVVALNNYRQSSGIDAKLVVVAVTATNFTIADPTDRGTLDIVGGDSNLPKLVSEFSAGRI
jgi:60 kDa SS-A/Ro ribonucleoprotein